MSALSRLRGALTVARARVGALVSGQVRRASEFDLRRLESTLRPQDTKQDVYTWEIPAIRSARDDQLRGKFLYPARLAEAMRTDEALSTAYRYRLAPQDSIGTVFEKATGVVPVGPHTPESVAAEAQAGVIIERGALNDISGCLANHGIAIGYNSKAPLEDGSRVSVIFKAWPIEGVRWDTTNQRLVTRVDSLSDEEAAKAREVMGRSMGSYSEIPIVHGDGRWVVFQKHSIDPWKQDAALLPGALVWARHAFAGRDWAMGSAAHGSAKIVGELAEGVSLTDAEGALTAEAAAFLSMLQSMVSGNITYGIRPYGSKTEWVSNSSTAWQVWSEMMLNAERAAARIYTGTDGILGAKGGAPGVDIQALFGVAVMFVTSDLTCIMRGLHTGTYEPWAALNYGDSRLAPLRKYQIPDVDRDAVRESFAKRNNALFVDMKSAKEAGCVVDQEYVDALADKHGVPAPKLAVGKPEGAGWFAYEVEGGIPTIDEVRATKGAGPHPNGLGYLTVPQMRALPPGAAPPPPPPAANPTAPAVPPPGNPDAAPSADPTLDPDGDGEPGEPPSNESAKRLADKMTAEQVDRCEHGACNKCRKCGIERDRDFEKDPETGEVTWKIAWKPIED